MIGTCKELIPKMLDLDQDKKYEIKEHRKKRSLNANDYYWVLVGKIADVLRAKKDDIHFQMLKDYGQCLPTRIPANEDINGYARYYEFIRTTKKNKEAYNEYMLYKGSSEMNSKEMSILIDGVIYEAKELDIETLPPNEINRLKNLWGSSK